MEVLYIKSISGIGTRYRWVLKREYWYCSGNKKVVSNIPSTYFIVFDKIFDYKLLTANADF